jgi:hypothetical protein
LKYNVYSYINQEIQADDSSTTTEKITRKTYKNLTLEEAKTQVNEILDDVPENISGFYLEVTKSYEEQMDSALKSI